MSTGTLRINVVTASGALPIPGATVSVFDPSAGTASPVYVLTADESGVCEEVSFETPDPALTFDPENTIAPYATVNLLVEAPGFRDVTVNGTQLFGGVRAQQQVSLQPQPEGEAGRVPFGPVDIPTHPLLTAARSGDVQIPRDQESAEPVYETVPPRILPETIIPSAVRVHLGRPTQAAQNVTVPFVDYIKNVCCSEIYPTWPEDSLRANIYAQISLILNRVFTEWYPSRGYTYDITNSTAYDQYFVFGRNIFENVSRLVDQIFNIYVNRIGTVGPYYTEYCNGTTATCPGMKQWGTVSLAQQGYSALAILKYYYGDDIQLIETNNIVDAQQSYPGTPLRRGATGSDVITIQRQLNRIRQNFPAIPVISAYGTFGPETEAAVRTFQDVFDLSVDGVVGKATWYEISLKYAAVKKLAELTSEGERPLGAYPGSPIRFGDSGADVQDVQIFLNGISAFYPEVPSVTVDGNFGPATRNSVTSFQNLYDLVPDGIVGQNTWNRLFAVYRSIYLASPTPDGRPQYPGTPLTFGSTGNDVRTMQTYLNYISSFYTEIPPVTPDGSFGVETLAAVIAYQRAFGLTPDGVIGPVTWDSIVDTYFSLQPGNGETAYPGTPLTPGSSGEAVRHVQTLLSGLSEVYPLQPSVAVDGSFGPLTQNAVVAFQTQFGLLPDGIVGETTWNRLETVANAAAGGKPVTAAPETPYPYPGTPLQVGSRGGDVRYMQLALRRISEGGQLITAPTADGVFGGETRRAVVAYQTAFGLTPDGIIGPATWQSIDATYRELFAGNGAAVPAAGQAAHSPAARSQSWPGTQFDIGAEGGDVRWIQQRLNALAQTYRAIPQLREDGDYGEKTAQAVTVLQTLFGLDPDGIVGKDTWRLLSTLEADGAAAYDAPGKERVVEDYVAPRVEQRVAEPLREPVPPEPAEPEPPQTEPVVPEHHMTQPPKPAAPAPKPPRSSDQYPGYPLLPGMRGEPVARIKRWLNQLAARDPGLLRVELRDDVFDESCRRAVQRLQRRLRLLPDGTVGRQTWDAIRAESKKN